MHYVMTYICLLSLSTVSGVLKLPTTHSSRAWPAVHDRSSHAWLWRVYVAATALKILQFSTVTSINKNQNHLILIRNLSFGRHLRRLIISENYVTNSTIN